MSCVTVSRKGQVVTPADLRKQLGFSRVVRLRCPWSRTRSKCRCSIRIGRQFRKPCAFIAKVLDFADTLHVIRSKKCVRFCTFDNKKFARQAKLAVVPEVVSRAEALQYARKAVGIYLLLSSAMPAAFERSLGIAGRTLMRIAEASGLDGEAELQTISESLAATGDGKDGADD